VIYYIYIILYIYIYISKFYYVKIIIYFSLSYFLIKIEQAIKSQFHLFLIFFLLHFHILRLIHHNSSTAYRQTISEFQPPRDAEIYIKYGCNTDITINNA